MPLESFESGILLQKCVQNDAIVKAGTVIAIIGREGEIISFDKEGQDRKAVQEVVLKKESSQSRISSSKRAFNASSLVIGIAKRKNIDLSKIEGTGPGGRIVKKDLERREVLGDKVLPVRESSPTEMSIEARTPPSLVEARTLPSAEVLSRRQESVGKALVRSKIEIPHYYVKVQINGDSAVQWRENKPHEDGRRVSFDSIFVFAAAKALRRFPRVNSSIHGTETVIHPHVSIGFAVAVGDELMVPVVKNADRKEIKEIDAEVRWLSAKAKSGKLEADDSYGGTFTISNLGMYPVQEFTAIINYPQSAILAFGKLQKALLVDDNYTMKIINTIVVTGSFDHRIINGAQAAQFLSHFKESLEKELK
jgi:pyruvate dehydrogenase E2 component (dihydrolipoamide acetyltransferase)